MGNTTCIICDNHLRFVGCAIGIVWCQCCLHRTHMHWLHWQWFDFPSGNCVGLFPHFGFCHSIYAECDALFGIVDKSYVCWLWICIFCEHIETIVRVMRFCEALLVWVLGKSSQTRIGTRAFPQASLDIFIDYAFYVFRPLSYQFFSKMLSLSCSTLCVIFTVFETSIHNIVFFLGSFTILQKKFCQIFANLFCLSWTSQPH